jgi:iron complex outermembrane receptor protein
VDTPRYFRIFLVSTAASLLYIPATLAAEDANSSELGEVVVTGQKQAYRGDTPLQELPQSVEVLTAAC